MLTAIFADVITPYPPGQLSLPERLTPPFFINGGSTAHILGTDTIGRDILSRTIFGARISLSVAVLVILISTIIGTIVGMISGYLGGRTDAVLMRVTDAALSFPSILIALLLAVSLGPSFNTVILALSALGWAPYARMIRGEVVKLRKEDFIAQARIIGSSPAQNNNDASLSQYSQHADCVDDAECRDCDSGGGFFKLPRGRDSAPDAIVGFNGS